ncbi:unnamed protein product [Periconia digitata]|uniref:Uncharacterized protein n=1 Tax=Periconia digitata TaxID=1303443 RepID=A0A9W4US70_9PLEO|nr:unnamed protein product [Periconia digitata]
MKLTSTALMALFATLSTSQQTGETVYLTNCGSTSEFSYYRPGHNSENRTPPDDRCRFQTGNNLPVNWENNARSCTFGTGVRFESRIGSGVPINAYAGPATQFIPGQAGRPWDCFRDNLRVLYQDGATSCNAVYWCNPQ